MSISVTKAKSKKSSGASIVHASGTGKWKVEKTGPISDLVGCHIHRLATETASLKLHPSKVIEAVQVGLPVQELHVLRASLDLPMDQLASKLGISRATLHRRKVEGRLGAKESDRVLRFARLMGKAIEVFGGQDEARRWLKSPQFGLGGAVPLDYAETEVGAREVENLLGRVEYGVYS